MIEVYPPANNLDYGSNVAPAPAPTSSSSTTGDIWRGHRITTVVPVAASTTLTTLGEAFSLSGSATGPALTTTNLLSSTPRYVTTSAAPANNQAGVTGTALYWLGNAAGLGGFRVEIEFGIVTTQTTLRACVGLVSNGGIAFTLSTDPSNITDGVFMGCNAGDTNMQMMHNDNAGTCTKIDLGSSFPKTANVVYRVLLRASQNASAIDYTVTRLDSAATASGTISTNLPASTAFLQMYCKLGNGTTASAVAMGYLRYMGEHGDMPA